MKRRRAEYVNYLVAANRRWSAGRVSVLEKAGSTYLGSKRIPCTSAKPLIRVSTAST